VDIRVDLYSENHCTLPHCLSLAKWTSCGELFTICEKPIAGKEKATKQKVCHQLSTSYQREKSPCYQTSKDDPVQELFRIFSARMLISLLP